MPLNTSENQKGFGVKCVVCGVPLEVSGTSERTYDVEPYEGAMRSGRMVAHTETWVSSVVGGAKVGEVSDSDDLFTCYACMDRLGGEWMSISRLYGDRRWMQEDVDEISRVIEGLTRYTSVKQKGIYEGKDKGRDGCVPAGEAEACNTL